MAELTNPSQPLPRRIAGLAILASFGAVVVAERDLRRRSADQVRGSRLVWRLGSTNAVVALAYLKWGRR
jgi:hypothetical protein